MEEISWDYDGRSGGNLASATISSMITRVWSARGNARFCLQMSFAVEHSVAGLVFICGRIRGGWLMGLEGRVDEQLGLNGSTEVFWPHSVIRPILRSFLFYI